MPDDEDRPRDAASAAGPGSSNADQADASWVNQAAPDDIRELDRDIHAYHRELRAARRRSRYRRFVARPDATPLVLVISALALVALVTTLLTSLASRADRGTRSVLPLASERPSDGRAHDLLPSQRLDGVGGTSAHDAQSLRPGLIALLPAHCSCGLTVHGLDDAAADAGSPLYVVAPGKPNADADSLSGQLHDNAGAYVFEDPDATLNSAVHAQGLTVVLVNPDGTIATIRRQVTTRSAASFTAPLRDMRQPRASI